MPSQLIEAIARTLHDQWYRNLRGAPWALLWEQQEQGARDMWFHNAEQVFNTILRVCDVSEVEGIDYTRVDGTPLERLNVEWDTWPGRARAMLQELGTQGGPDDDPWRRQLVRQFVIKTPTEEVTDAGTT